MSKRKIDKVTVKRLDLALRMCNIEFAPSLIDKIIDLVELIEDKGGKTSIRDIAELQNKWNLTKQQ